MPQNLAAFQLNISWSCFTVIINFPVECYLHAEPAAGITASNVDELTTNFQNIPTNRQVVRWMALISKEITMKLFEFTEAKFLELF
jgi:hypothetical protein